MMSTITTTIVVAFIFVLLAMAALGISWLITGKLSLRPGACGRDPNKKRDQNCGSDESCGLCKKDTKKGPK